MALCIGLLHTLMLIRSAAAQNFLIETRDLGAFEAGWSSVAFSVNSSGAVVGWSNDYYNFVLNASTDSMVYLQHPYGGWSAANDINDSGMIAAQSAYVAWIWDPSTQSIKAAPIPASATNTGNSCRTGAHGVSGQGVVVGWIDNCGHTQAWSWNTNTNDYGIAALGGAVALKINDAGHAIVNTNPGAGGSTYRWDTGTNTMLYLGSLGGVTEAYGISNAGVIVGASGVGGNSKAFRWDPQSQSMRDLGSLGGLQSAAQSVNDLGQIVGWSLTPSGTKHAFLWDPATERMIDLGTLPNGTESVAYDLNSNGQIVGYSLVGGKKRATRWTVTVVADLVVTTTADNGPGSLRQAIVDANMRVGRDTIWFNIPGLGSHTIVPTSPLPTITDPVVIDGTSQPGYLGSPLIELSGTAAGASNGLDIQSGDNEIHGLAINRFPYAGINVRGPGGNKFTRNYLGVSPNGTSAAGNSVGVQFRSPNNVLGGETIEERNVISGNGYPAVELIAGADNSVIRGNYIGTTADGTRALVGGQSCCWRPGIVIYSNSNIVGGRTENQRNVISGNSGGVHIGTTAVGNRIIGNYIGTNATGALNMANYYYGVAVEGESNAIGSISPGEGNIIARNVHTGVIVSRGTGNRVSGNSIFTNGALGIDLGQTGADGVTPNDAGDLDTGPNNFQNFPVLASAVATSSGATTVVGSLSSEASKNYAVEFFSNDVLDPSGYGEGRSFLGVISITTNTSGFAGFTFQSNTPIGVGQFITATATDTQGSTSEFSAGVAIVGESADISPPVAASQIWRWSQPTNDPALAIAPRDGSLIASGNETFGNDGVGKKIDPRTGAILNARFPSPATRNNIWVSPTEDFIVGGYQDKHAYRIRDGSHAWSWIQLGCCNGVPMALDPANARGYIAINWHLVDVNLNTGVNTLRTTAGDWIGFTSIVNQNVAYQAGSEGSVASLRLNSAGREWTVKLDVASRPLRPGAVAADGSFIVTSSGDHTGIGASSQPIVPGILARVRHDGTTAWNLSVNAVTPPVIGRNGLVFVGTQVSPVSPSGPGAIEAYSVDSGRLVWRAPVLGQPNDLLVGDDGLVYAVVGSYSNGSLIGVGQTDGVRRVTVTGVPGAWELILDKGTIYASGSSITAVPVSAQGYDLLAPWPVRYHDNQRTGNATAPLQYDLDPGTTPTGSDIAVQPNDATTGQPAPVTLTFDSVTSAGTTTTTSKAIGSGGGGPPAPSSFRLGSPPTYFDIETSAIFTGNVTVCFDYTVVSYGNESRLRLLHYNSGAWVDITLAGYPDLTSKRICGRASSLSPFLAAELNAAPAVTAITLPPNPAMINTAAQVSAGFTDENPRDTHTAMLTWNLGSAQMTVTESNGAGTTTASLSFAEPGVYRVTVSVSDGDLEGTRESTADNPAYIVIYDPSAGFVTGGGWIESPPGAYTPDDNTDPDLAGKANFGFVSRYKKGATVPTGETQFQFSAANLNFHSTAYDWLVISGPKAQYKGTGTANGVEGYGFLLTANDGQVTGGGGTDRFRIKIWDKPTGVRLYDNQPADADDASAATVIGGGSIVIQKSGSKSAKTDDVAVELPTEYGLAPSYPNPFNPTTTIRFALPEESRVELTLYDVIGRHVRTLANGTLAAGYHDAVFDADGLPSGLYLARLSTPAGTFVQKMMLLK